MFTNLNSTSLYQIMNHNNIWSGVTYSNCIGDCLVEAYIPQESLTKAHTVPKRIMNWLNRPCAENRMKLMVNGVTVRYTYAESSMSESILKEVA